jgi:transposase
MTFSYKLAHPCDLIERRSYQQSNSAQQAAGNETRFGFKLLPYRWVVERTFAWLSGYRRFSRDYEFLVKTSDAMIYAAMAHLMLRRLAPDR